MTSLRGADRQPRPPRSLPSLILAGLLAATIAAGFMSLGIWQIERRAWKLALIERVATRVHATPIAAPGPDRWPNISRASDEYRRVTATGRYLTGLDTQVRGVSVLGAGFWLLSPLRTTAGFTVLINRGFVTDDASHRWVSESTARDAMSTDSVSVTGLLRITEPHGRFLRSNDPLAGHWYSRDVQAIADARHLHDVAPYFIDIDARADPDVVPVTGLTVTDFPNNHLQYAVTWFALGLMTIAAILYVGRFEWQLRHAGRPDS